MQKLNHWTARDIPELCILKWKFYVKWILSQLKKKKNGKLLSVYKSRSMGFGSGNLAD